MAGKLTTASTRSSKVTNLVCSNIIYVQWPVCVKTGWGSSHTASYLSNVPSQHIKEAFYTFANHPLLTLLTKAGTEPNILGSSVRILFSEFWRFTDLNSEWEPALDRYTLVFTVVFRSSNCFYRPQTLDSKSNSVCFRQAAVFRCFAVSTPGCRVFSSTPNSEKYICFPSQFGRALAASGWGCKSPTLPFHHHQSLFLPWKTCRPDLESVSPAFQRSHSSVWSGSWCRSQTIKSQISRIFWPTRNNSASPATLHP